MRDRKSQSAAALLAVLVVLVLRWTAGAQEPPRAEPGEAEVFGTDSPLGRIEYRAGRGLRLGNTRLTLGGFATAEVERLEGDERRASIEGVNFFLFFDPVSFVHVFSELEVGGLAEWEGGRKGVSSNPDLGVERLYADLTANDALNVRFGKFFTPIGRWNQAAAEPLVWTTSEPVIVEDVFDEAVSGAMLWGSVFPRGRALSYSLYGKFLGPITQDPDKPPAEHSAGGRLEWASLTGWSLGASYFASEPRRKGDWNHLGGIDALWRPTGRVELSGEAVIGEGTRQEGGLGGFFGQAVVETVRTLYAVGRYEWFDPPGRGRAINLFDVGVTWVPRYYLRLKADYQFADHFDEHAAPGFRASFSVLF